MDKVQRIQTLTRTLHSLYARRTCRAISRKLSTESSSNQEKQNQEHLVKDDSLNQVIPERIDSSDNSSTTLDSNDLHVLSDTSVNDDSTTKQKRHSFPYLLRNSAFINIGDPREKIVSGTIFHVVDDDLYIDFGWKFHCVCRRPQKNQEKYVRGTRVQLLVKNLELSTRFLGATKDITLCEADCVLFGLNERTAQV